MHDALFENQPKVSSPVISDRQELELPEAALRNALETGQYRNKVRSDCLGGVRSGVNGTPTFFINGILHDRGDDYTSLMAEIQARLAADTRA